MRGMGGAAQPAPVIELDDRHLTAIARAPEATRVPLARTAAERGWASDETRV